MARQCRGALEHPYEPGYDRCKLDEGHAGTHQTFGGRGVWSDSHVRHIEVPLEEEEVVERIVSWLRTTYRTDDAHWDDPITARYVSTTLADLIERGEWKSPPNEGGEQ